MTPLQHQMNLMSEAQEAKHELLDLSRNQRCGMSIAVPIEVTNPNIGLPAPDWWNELPEDQRRELAKPFIQDAARNEPCPCGSGKKFKKCCQI